MFRSLSLFEAQVLPFNSLYFFLIVIYGHCFRPLVDLQAFPVLSIDEYFQYPCNFVYKHIDEPLSPLRKLNSMHERIYGLGDFFIKILLVITFWVFVFIRNTL